MAMVSRQSIKKALGGALKSGQKVGYGKIQKILGAAGVSPRYAGSVKDYQAKAAFRKLKEAGVLSGRAAQAGAESFMRAVKKAEAPVGPSKEQVASRAKAALRERLAEEEAKKQRITEALQKGVKREERGMKDGKKEEAGRPGLRGAAVLAARPVAPRLGEVEIPTTERPESVRPAAAAEPAEEAGPDIPSISEAKDLPLD